MATKNDITGDSLITKPATDKYRDGWSTAFTKPPVGEDVRPKDRVKQGISGHCVIEDWPESKPKGQRIVLNINGQYISLDPTDTITIKYE